MGQMKAGADGFYRHTWTFEGKRYSVRAKSERDLWKKVAEKEQLLKSGMITTNENTPVSKWFSDYLETYKRPAVTERTYKQLQSYVRNYISPSIGSRRIKDIRTIDLQRTLNECAGQSLSQVTKLRNLICSAFRQARIDRVIVFDPAEGVTMPDAEEGTHRPVTDDERRHILAVCETHRAGMWILFMLHTGARPDETRKALWEDIDFKARKVVLHSAKNDYGDRIVPMSQTLYDLLRSKAGDGYIFVQPTTGRPHTKTSMRQMWETFKRKLDIHMGAKTFRGAIIPETSVVAEDLVPYCMRHTYATDLQTAGVPINIAKDLLGHKHITMTARIYTHLSEEAFSSAAAKVYALDDARASGKIASLHG